MKIIVDNNFIRAAFKQHSPMVMRLAAHYTQNKADAQDIVQDVFMALLDQAYFNDAEHLKAWLIRVTVNKCINHIKTAKRKANIPLDTMRFGLEAEEAEVLSQIQELPQLDRTVIYLHYFEGYSAKEIARMLNKKENTIHARFVRARKKLKNILEEEKNEIFGYCEKDCT